MSKKFEPFDEWGRERIRFPWVVDMWSEGYLQQTMYFRNIEAAKFARRLWKEMPGKKRRTYTKRFAYNRDQAWHGLKEWSQFMRFYVGDKLVMKLRMPDTMQAGFLRLWWESAPAQDPRRPHRVKWTEPLPKWLVPPNYKPKKKMKGPKGPPPF